MAGSPPPPAATARQTQDSDGRHHRGRVVERGESTQRSRAVSRGRASQDQEPKPGSVAPPHFSPSSPPPPFASTHGRRRRAGSGSRDRHPRLADHVDEDLLLGTGDSRTRSSDVKSHRSHRHSQSPTSHKHRRCRSPSTSTHRHKGHRSRRSRSREREGRQGRDTTHISERSPRRASKDGTVASRRDADTDRRYRSRSRDGRYGDPPADRRREASVESLRRTSGDSRRHAHSRERDSRYDYSPPRQHRSHRDREEYHSRPSRRSPPRGSERRSHHYSRHSRSPPPSLSRRGSHGSLRQERPPTREDYKHRSRRSVSRESRRSRRDERDRDDEMYGRGGSRGGYHGYSHGHGHRGYSSGYPSNAPSPIHGHQQSYPNGPSSQSGGSYYQQRQGRLSNQPSHPGGQTPQRGGPSQRGGRGHFANLSWTPSDGVRGGHLVQPGEKSREGSVATAGQPKEKSGDPDDADNPFRPPADLRAEDENVAKKRKIDSDAPSAVKEGDAAGEKEKSKISFSIKGRASAQAASATKESQSAPKNETSPLQSKKVPAALSPLVQASVPKSRNYEGNTRLDSAPRKPSPPPTRKEVVRKKRIKAKPTLTEDFAQSDSVYYRKTGNESVIGSGTYGKVYKAIHVYTGRMVALKKIRMEGERDGFPVTATREIKLLQSLNHVNVVPLQEVMVERNDCFMVFEYQAHDLTGLLNHPTFSLTEGHKKHLAKQMFEGLAYLHQRGVLHRDIKAANILISKTGELKYADFGLARFYQKRQNQDYTNRVITIWYRPPELLLGETQYGGAVDIWSAACVLVEIFTRHAIFPGDGGEINQLDKIYNVLGTPSRSEWPGITELQWYELLRPTHRIQSSFKQKYEQRVPDKSFELLEMMFAYDPANRPTASDVLEHEYFYSDPKPQQVWELAELEGDWHEFESKAARKEKERQEREARRKDREVSESKRKAEEDAGKGEASKRLKTSAQQAPAG